MQRVEKEELLLFSNITTKNIEFFFETRFIVIYWKLQFSLYNSLHFDFFSEILSISEQLDEILGFLEQLRLKL